MQNRHKILVDEKKARTLRTLLPKGVAGTVQHVGLFTSPSRYILYAVHFEVHEQHNLRISVIILAALFSVNRTVSNLTTFPCDKIHSAIKRREDDGQPFFKRILMS